MEDQKDKQCRIIFLQPVFIIFTRGAINFDHDCIVRGNYKQFHSLYNTETCKRQGEMELISETNFETSKALK